MYGNRDNRYNCIRAVNRYSCITQRSQGGQPRARRGQDDNGGGVRGCGDIRLRNAGLRVRLRFGNRFGIRFFRRFIFGVYGQARFVYRGRNKLQLFESDVYRLCGSAFRVSMVGAVALCSSVRGKRYMSGQEAVRFRQLRGISQYLYRIGNALRLYGIDFAVYVCGRQRNSVRRGVLSVYAQRRMLGTVYLQTASSLCGHHQYPALLSRAVPYSAESDFLDYASVAPYGFRTLHSEKCVSYAV